MLSTIQKDGIFHSTRLQPIDDSSYRRNFDLDKKNEIITIAGKSMLK